MCDIINDKDVKDYMVANGEFDKKEKEKEMDALGLDENEKDLVRKGVAEPFDFNEDPDDMEDDDYYSEDDI